MTRETAIRWVAKPLVFASALIPLAWVAWTAISSGLGPTGPLGANPIEYINRFLGDWAIRFLLLALAVTPVRGITGWTPLMRFRRMIGLFALFCASMHVSSYIVPAPFFHWLAILSYIVQRHHTPAHATERQFP